MPVMSEMLPKGSCRASYAKGSSMLDSQRECGSVTGCGSWAAKEMVCEHRRNRNDVPEAELNSYCSP